MDSFNDIGFLSKDLDQWEKNSRIEFGAEVELAERINRLAMRIMFALPTENITNEKAMAAAAFGQATQSYQISLQLALKGAMCESRAVARLCTEAVIAVGALEKVPSTAQAFAQDYDHHRKTLSNSILQGLEGAKPDKESSVKLKAVVAEVNKTYGDERIGGIRWVVLAEQAGLKGLYDIGYRMLSGDAAHINLGSLNRHVIAGKDMQLSGFRFHPEKADFKSTLFAASSAMVHLFSITVHWFQVLQFNDEVNACVANWKAIHNGSIQ